MTNGLSTQRIEPLSTAEIERIAADAGIPAELLDRNIFRVLYRSPRVAKAMQELLYVHLYGSALDDRLRELVIMRIGWITGCDYEWAQHWFTAISAFGCSADDLLAVRDWRTSTHLGDVDRAVLAATDEVVNGGSISDATWQLCCAHLPNRQACLELVTAIATWHAISLILRSLHVPLEEDTPSWPPDGQAPVIIRSEQ